jgi:hypothetical protein
MTKIASPPHTLAWTREYVQLISTVVIGINNIRLFTASQFHQSTVTIHYGCVVNMSQLHSHCTVWVKNDANQKIRIKGVWTVRFIELYRLCRNTIFCPQFTLDKASALWFSRTTQSWVLSVLEIRMVDRRIACEGKGTLRHLK